MATWGVLRVREERDHAALRLVYLVDDVPLHVQHSLTVANLLVKAGHELEPGDAIVRLEGQRLGWDELQFSSRGS